MVKFPQVEAGQLFDLFQPVDKGVAVNEQFSGGFRHVQVILKELMDGEESLVVERIDRAGLEDLLEEGLTEGGRQLVDQPGDAEVVIADN